VDSVLIGVPGTLRPVKGHPFLLDVAERVITARPQVQFLITGDGTPAYRQQLQEQASRQKLEHHVRFLGTIPDMRSFYRACDLICVPSRSESFGRTVIEAFAAGCPVVGSQVGGICETIDQGNTGVLVPYGDVAGFAEAVIALIDSPARRDELAKRASARARSEFRSSVYQQRIAEIVKQVVERKRRW
jgi:glycosyltransferase involved in cell wall biosynthesis